MKEKRFILTGYERSRGSKAEGFTLVELLLALLVAGTVAVGALGIIYQTAWGTPRTNSRIIALTDINQIALAIKNDLMMAQTTDLGSTPQSSANLVWIDYSSFDGANQTSHSIGYALSGTQLRRTYDGTMSIVGRRVSSINFTQSGQLVTVVITTSGGGASPQIETLRFSSHIRREEGEE